MQKNQVDTLVRVKQIVADKTAGHIPLLPISRAAWYAGVESGKYPPPDVRLGSRTVCWRMSTIQSVIDGSWKGGAA